MKNIKIMIIKFPANKIVFGLSFVHNARQTAICLDFFKYGITIGHYR